MATLLWDGIVIVEGTEPVLPGAAVRGPISPVVQLVTAQHSFTCLRVDHNLPPGHDATFFMCLIADPSGEESCTNMSLDSADCGKIVLQFGPGNFKFLLELRAGALPIPVGSFVNPIILMAEALE